MSRLRLDQEQVKPSGDFTQSERVAAGKRWFDGYGRSEVRSQNLHGLLWTITTVAAVVLAVIQILR